MRTTGSYVPTNAIARAFVVGCRVYTQFVGGKVVMDECASEQAAHEYRNALRNISVAMHGGGAAA